MTTATQAWRKQSTPPPANLDDLTAAAAARDGSAFAREFATYCAQLAAEGYPPPALVGWLDEETGEVS